MTAAIISRPPTPQTKFFPRVWAAVRAIPRGQVRSYGQVAKTAGRPLAARAVASALRAAPPGLPWHRVLGAGGRIRLRGTAGLEQRMRLMSEGARFRGSRVIS